MSNPPEISPVILDTEKSAAFPHHDMGYTVGEGDHTDRTDLNLKEAILSEEADHAETAWEAIKRHPQAIFWAWVFSMLVVMEAFDNDLMGSLIAMPAFRQHYGFYVNAKSGYQIPAQWQTALGLAPTIGSFFGIICCGYIVNRLGYRFCALIGLALMTCFIFVPFFSPTLPVLFVGEILCGFPWGFFICIGPAYASEVSPLAIRGPLTLWIQACWCIGHFIEAGVVYGTQARTDQWAYKIPFAIQWAWPLPLAIMVYLAPESPWWLVRRGRLQDAEDVITRLGIAAGTTPRQRTAEMARTIEIEKQTTAGTSYVDCFKGTDFRRTAIASCIFMAQNYTGYSLAGNTTYFFEQAGIATQQAFALSLGTVAIQMSAVFACAFATNWLGRRTLYLWGLGFTMTCLLIMGILSSVPENQATKWVLSTLTILVVVQYGATIGPITYAIIAEVSSIRLRAQTVAISRAAYYVSTIPSTFIGSYSLNPSAWNLKGKAGFIWLGTGAFVYVMTYFFLPELKGRSYRELDILFHRKIPARQFSKTTIEEDVDE